MNRKRPNDRSWVQFLTVFSSLGFFLLPEHPFTQTSTFPSRIPQYIRVLSKIEENQLIKIVDP